MQKSAIGKNLSPTQNLYKDLYGKLPDHDLDPSHLPKFHGILTTLTERETYTLALRYGFPHESVAEQNLEQKPRSYKKVGDALGVTAERARQIIIRALRKLRNRHRALTPHIEPAEEIDKLTEGIETLDLSTRTYNCLRRAGVDTLADIIEKFPTPDSLLEIRSFGRSCLEEALGKLAKYGIFQLEEAA